ncbi:MAG: aminotransferase class I/II-fold pyridoxal phosphate-dependent enzyme [Clostridia bacterium]|nr:aminotransferase class I/II-fold pyridoxal phosphate-dependent enzyme [Clostridia bacterium]
MKHGGNVWEGGRPDKWLDFSANLRPEGPPEWVVRVMKRALDNARYYPDRAMRAAREGLAAYAGLRTDEILPTAGGVAAIDLALSLGRGRVIVDPVTFGEYRERALVHQRTCLADPDACRAGDLRIICNPNNPTGSVMTREQVLNLYETVHGHGGELMVDEAFADYCPEISVRTSIRSGLTVTGSLTKILCIPGVRLGYICGEAPLIERLQSISLPWALNHLASAIAAELPNHLDEIRADAAANAARRETMTEALSALGAKVQPSRTNFVLCNFGRDMSACVKRLREKGILVRECGSFGLDGGWLRFAVRTDEENECLIEELKKCLGF